MIQKVTSVFLKSFINVLEHFIPKLLDDLIDSSEQKKHKTLCAVKCSETDRHDLEKERKTEETRLSHQSSMSSNM